MRWPSQSAAFPRLVSSRRYCRSLCHLHHHYLVSCYCHRWPFRRLHLLLSTCLSTCPKTNLQFMVFDTSTLGTFTSSQRQSFDLRCQGLWLVRLLVCVLINTIDTDPSPLIGRLGWPDLQPNTSLKPWVHCMSFWHFYISKINMRVTVTLHSFLAWQALENALRLHTNLSRVTKKVL